jgi:Zn-dependent oligopeptidase
MHLDKKTKKNLLKLKNQLNKIGSQFEKATTKNYENGAFFTKEELKGIPENVFQSLKFDQKKKKYFISILPTIMQNVTKYCEVESTRKKIVDISAFGVGDVNTKRFSEILKLRSEISKILSFKTFSDLAISDEMMNKTKDINFFLKNLTKTINPLFKHEKEKDLNILQSWENDAFKKVQTKKLNTWSWGFAGNLRSEKELGIKSEEYKPYFELENVLNVLFKMWEEIFNVKTTEIKDKHFFDISDRFYEFTDISSGELLGNGVFDLFPRSGKYGHACMNEISVNHKKINNDFKKSFIYMISNFMKNENGKTLLAFSDVVTLFHEAGHFLHFLLMKNNYKSTGSVSNDFVEIPSQFMENFVLNEKFVSENFKHFETGESMPKRLLNKINKIYSKGEASMWMIQSLYSIFDQELHGKNMNKYFNYKNIDKLFESEYKKMINVESSKERHFTSRFSHLVHGYESRYYSYVISKVFSVDFWNEFAKGGIKKGKMSEKYKRFLEGANTKEEKVLVEEYLGREVSQKPFLDSLK